MSGQEELARRRRDLQYRAGFHLFMHPARRHALRLVLYRDPIGFTIGGIRNGIVALDGGMTRNFEPEGQILAGLMLDDRTTIRRSEEHTSELQSLMRISYAVFCLKKKKKKLNTQEDR